MHETTTTRSKLFVEAEFVRLDPARRGQRREPLAPARQKRVARETHPRELGHRQHARGQPLERVVGKADELEVGAPDERVRQLPQLVVRQHHLAQPFGQLARQRGQLVVGQDEPLERRRERGGRDARELIRLEGEHVQRGEHAEH